MNGSNHAAGRQGPAMAMADHAPWGSPSPWAEQRFCVLCRQRREATASCEEDERILGVLDNRRGKPLVIGLPPCVVVCKDCCIAALAGHGCPWRDLCWRD